MRSMLVVVGLPASNHRACVPQTFKPLGVEAFVSHAAVEAFAQRIFNGFAGLDVLHVDALALLAYRDDD